MTRAPHLYVVESVDMSTTVRVPPAWKVVLAGFDAELRAADRPRSTRDMRFYQLRRFASDHAHTTPPDITREHLITWLGSREWATETRRAYRAALVTFFRWMHRTGHVPDNPANDLPKVMPANALPRPAPDDVLLAGLRDIDERASLAVEIMDGTGLRRAECAALHSRNVMSSVHGPELRILGKGRRIREVPVPERIARSIRDAQGFVFPGQIDGHISPHYLGKLVSRALPGDWTAHTLRHRYATRVYHATGDLLAVQKLLGHASVRTTEIYIGLADDRLRTAAQTAWALPTAA